MSDHEDRRAPDASSEEELQELFDLAGPRIAVPEEAMASLREISRERWQAKTRWRRRRPLVLSGLALAAAVLLTLVLLPRLVPGGDRSGTGLALASLVAGTGERVPSGGETEIASGPGDALRAGELLLTAEGRVALALAEGGSLRVDRETRLRFLGPARLELDRGAIYFDSVGRAADAPALELRTPVGTVFDIGTRFETRVDGEALQVRVREGEVRVEGAEGSASAEAGEVLRVSPTGAVLRGRVEPWDPTFAWIHEAAPSFDIEGRRLEAFLEWAVREGGWNLAVEDDATRRVTAETVLHGTVEGLAPRAALDLVLPGAGLGYTIEEGTLRVKREGTR